MILDQPDAKDLLDTARRALRDEILPATPSDHALTVLMVMRAMEIAMRALGDAEDALEARQHERLRRLTGEARDASALAASIRDGEWDDEAAARSLHGMLVEESRERLARANPKYLAQVLAEERKEE